MLYPLLSPRPGRVLGGAAFALSGLLILGARLAPAAEGGESPAEQAAGILSRRCISCHDAEKKAGGIDLSTREGAAKIGGMLGDDPAKNRLVKAVVTGRMPPTGKLPADETAAIRAWAKAGGVYARSPLTLQKLSDQPLWSLAPVRATKPPTTPFDKLARNPVDRFLFQGLAAKGLKPSPPAGKLELLRRVTVDLTGLPPTPEEVTAFQADRSPDAYEKVVDRLLASTAYGERWGRHWLDVVRFGESNGFETNHIRPNAWPFRDYVIRAFNQDLPMDRFIREQIAGDVLGKGDPWAEAATGFLVAGVHDIVGNQAEEGKRRQRADDLDDIVATTSEAFLGLTVGCAKCHDHKFDPIPQTDYYRLAAVFAGVRHGERPLANGGLGGNRRAEEFAPVSARFVRLTVAATEDGAEPCIDELEVSGPAGGNLALASAGAKASASGLLPGYPQHQVPHLNDGKLGNDFSWISNEPGKGWAQIELPAPATINRVVWSRDGRTESRFRDRMPSSYRVEVSADGQLWTKVAEKSGAPRPKDIVAPGIVAYAGQFGAIEPVHLLKRGDVMQRGDEMKPGSLSRINALPSDIAAGTDAERRSALAAWMTDARNPLTARVLVNRVWHYHFGRGLVGTPSDFGHNGEKPSHPELLDWLVSEFTKPDSSPGVDRGTEGRGDGGKGSTGGWRMKALHRLLVTSYAYRQSSAADPVGMAKDAGNRLIWRMPLRRMEAEAVRDAVLAASGKLDRRMGGPGYPLFKYRTVNVAIYEPLDEYGPETWRRGVYRQTVRAIREDLLGSLDCPDSAQRTPRRESTTTALQALSLLNGSFMGQQSRFLAERVEREGGADVGKQVERAFLITLGRPPSATESGGAAELVRKRGLEPFCRALLNANEFLYY